MRPPANGTTIWQEYELAMQKVMAEEKCPSLQKHLMERACMREGPPLQEYEHPGDILHAAYRALAEKDKRRFEACLHGIIKNFHRKIASNTRVKHDPCKLVEIAILHFQLMEDASVHGRLNLIFLFDSFINNITSLRKLLPAEITNRMVDLIRQFWWRLVQESAQANGLMRGWVDTPSLFSDLKWNGMLLEAVSRLAPDSLAMNDLLDFYQQARRFRDGNAADGLPQNRAERSERVTELLRATFLEMALARAERPDNRKRMLTQKELLYLDQIIRAQARALEPIHDFLDYLALAWHLGADTLDKLKKNHEILLADEKRTRAAEKGIDPEKLSLKLQPNNDSVIYH